jgi:hypothetical protein
MTRAEAAELLELLCEQAQRLREAGIAEVDLSKPSFVLRPFEPAVQIDDEDHTEDWRPRNPLEDRATFGGGPVPSLKRNEQ